MELTEWFCAPSEADAINDPIALDADRDNNSRHSLDWIAATVPGTAASAWRAAGRVLDVRDINFDDRDWWFRTRFDWTDGIGNEEVVFGGWPSGTGNGDPDVHDRIRSGCHEFPRDFPRHFEAEGRRRHRDLGPEQEAAYAS